MVVKSMFLKRMRDGVSFQPFISFKIWTLHEFVSSSLHSNHANLCIVQILIHALPKLFHHLADAGKINKNKNLPLYSWTLFHHMMTKWISREKKAKINMEFSLCTSVPSWTITFRDPCPQIIEPVRARETPSQKNKNKKTKEPLKILSMSTVLQCLQAVFFP